MIFKIGCPTIYFSVDRIKKIFKPPGELFLSLGIKVLNEILTVNISIEENQDLKLASAASEEVHLLPEDPTKIINIVFIPMKTTWITLPKGKGHFMV